MNSEINCYLIEIFQLSNNNVIVLESRNRAIIIIIIIWLCLSCVVCHALTQFLSLIILKFQYFLYVYLMSRDLGRKRYGLIYTTYSIMVSRVKLRIQGSYKHDYNKEVHHVFRFKSYMYFQFIVKNVVYLNYLNIFVYLTYIFVQVLNKY